MHLLIMGVSGCGKSTIGRRVAAAAGVPFLDADDFHSAASIARMRAGIPLDEADREPWLRALGNALRERPDGFVLACSALKRRYRDVLREACPQLQIAWLQGDRNVLAARLSGRTGHFMSASPA